MRSEHHRHADRRHRHTVLKLVTPFAFLGEGYDDELETLFTETRTEDVVEVIPDVLRHRLVLSYEALSDQLTADRIVQRIMQHLPAPEKPLEAHVKVG